MGAELKDAFAGRAKGFVNAALAEGTMILVAGANVIRFTPSLVVPLEDIDQGIAQFEKAVASIVNA